MSAKSKTLSQLPAECPIDRLVNVLSPRWTIEVLREVALGPTRTSAFIARTPGLTMRSLVRRLKALEEFGLVARFEAAEVPVKVTYELTMHGKELLPLLEQLKCFADKLSGMQTCICSVQKSCRDGQTSICCPHRKQTQSKRRSC